MAILDDLEGFLGADAVAKLKSNPAALERFSKTDELESYYYGDGGTPPPAVTPPARREPPPASGAPAAGGGESLAAIMARLDSFGDINKTVKEAVQSEVTTRGNELVNNAIAISMRNTRELTKIDSKHRAEFNEDLDDAKLEAHVAAAIAAGRPFRTITDAYEDMTREARFEKKLATGVETGVREKLKERASGNVPGVTPQAATPMLRVLKSSGHGSNEGAGTAVSRAARALEDKLAERGEQVA